MLCYIWMYKLLSKYKMRYNNSFIINVWIVDFVLIAMKQRVWHFSSIFSLCHSCREYAEHVKNRFGLLGLNIEGLQLSSTMSLADALDQAAQRGLLYVIIVSTQNEVHNSVTLTILHGRNPQGKVPSRLPGPTVQLVIFFFF